MTACGAALATADAFPAWTAAPFAVFLLSIAAFPLLAPRFWASNRNKLLVGLGFGLPVAIYLLATSSHGGEWLAHAGEEYAAFMAVLGALYIVAGGGRFSGTLPGTPAVNTLLLATGAMLASFIGTTGASMVLIRPLLRANERRERQSHLVVFFIFVVANSGGLLTPLGDPPLYLGFLRGVPFTWTFTLILPWAMVNGVLLALFYAFDRWMYGREVGATVRPPEPAAPLRFKGSVNLLILAAIPAFIYVMGRYGPALASNVHVRIWMLIGGLALLAGVSLAATPAGTRRENAFTWHPLAEVAAIFAGIFVTMIPALQILNAGAADGRIVLTHPREYFWATGLLSAMLDNAPTYLTFGALAAGRHGVDPSRLGDLITAGGEAHLAAISCGAVFFGAMTYIGNGPNFMVKAIAEERGVKMPGFFGYMAWSAAILLPLFVVVTFMFF